MSLYSRMRLRLFSERSSPKYLTMLSCWKVFKRLISDFEGKSQTTMWVEELILRYHHLLLIDFGSRQTLNRHKSTRLNIQAFENFAKCSLSDAISKLLKKKKKKKGDWVHMYDQNIYAILRIAQLEVSCLSCSFFALFYSQSIFYPFAFRGGRLLPLRHRNDWFCQPQQSPLQSPNQSQMIHPQDGFWKKLLAKLKSILGLLWRTPMLYERPFPEGYKNITTHE